MIWKNHERTAAPIGDVARFWEALGYGLLDLFRGSPCVSTIFAGHYFQVLSGCISPQFNASLILHSPYVHESIRLCCHRAAQRRVSATLLCAGFSDDEISTLPVEPNWQEQESLPLMYCTGSATAASAELDFQLAQSEADLLKTHRIISSAYGIPEPDVTRAFPVEMITQRDLSVFLAGRFGDCIGCVQATRRKNIAVFWSLAVAPDQQSRGTGEFLLRSAMHCLKERGADHFLMLGAPGPRYRFESLGFRTVDSARVYVVSPDSLPPGSSGSV